MNPMTQNNKDLHEVEDPKAEYYEPGPEGEKDYWKRHIIKKYSDRNGNGDDVFKASNIAKDKSRLPGDPKADLDDPSDGNKPVDELPAFKTYKAQQMKTRSSVVSSMKGKVAAFKEHYGDQWKDAMGSTDLSEEETDLNETPDRYGSQLANHVKMALKIAKDNAGDMTGATSSIERMRRGLSNHPQVKAALRQANEETNIDEATKGQVKVNVNTARLKKAVQKTKVGTFDVRSNLQWPIHKVKSTSFNPDFEQETLIHHVRAKDKHAAVGKIMLDLSRQGHDVAKVTHHGIVKEETVLEDSQAAASDNPGGAGPPTTTVDNNNSHLNNNPTGDAPSKGDVKNTLEAIAMQAAELHDQLEDGQEIDSKAQAMLSEAKDALDQVYEIVTNGGGAQDAKSAPAPKNGGASANVKEDFNDLAEEGEMYMARNQLMTAQRAIVNLLPMMKGSGDMEAWVQSKITQGAQMLDTVADYMQSKAGIKEDFEEVDDSYELVEATVKDKTGTIVGTHKAGEGFKPNSLGKKLGHKAHPTDVPKDTTITKRGRKVGSKSFGASKRRDLTSDEAGTSGVEKPSFTDQLLKAVDHHSGGHVTFDDGSTHHIPRPHARAGLYHLGKPEKPDDKKVVRKHIGASKANFDSYRKSGGQLPKATPAYDPDAKIKANTARITAGTKRPATPMHIALAQRILAKRKAK